MIILLRLLSQSVVKVMMRGVGSIMKDLEYPIKGFCFLLEMTEIIVCAQLFQCV